MKKIQILTVLLLMTFLAALTSCASEPKIEDYSGVWKPDAEKTLADWTEEQKRDNARNMEYFILFDFDKKVLGDAKDPSRPASPMPFALEKVSSSIYKISLPGGDIPPVTLELLDKDKAVLTMNKGKGDFKVYLTKTGDKANFETSAEQ